MADPSMQTFCCHRSNHTDIALSLRENFNAELYNLICVFSSSLGILGGIYQILPRKEYTKNHRWLSFSATKGRRIIVYLAISDLFASMAVLLRSIAWLKFNNIMPAMDDNASVIFCIITSVFIQYFYTSTWIWTFCYALDIRFILSEREIKVRYYHLAAWILPLFTTGIGLTILYFPDANCHTSKSLVTALTRILPNYLASYIPILVVMIYNPFLYYRSTKDMESIITGTSGQFTAKEREIIEAVKMKFALINLVFYICWLANLINGVMLWIVWFDSPASYIITLWYATAFLNPLQALLNCLVYRRWNKGSEKIILPWKHSEKQTTIREVTDSNSENTKREEVLPLLKNVASEKIKPYYR